MNENSKNNEHETEDAALTQQEAKTSKLIESVDGMIGEPVKEVLFQFQKGVLTQQEAKDKIMKIVESQIGTFLNTIESAREQ